MVRTILMACVATAGIAFSVSDAQAAVATFTFPPGGIIQSAVVSNSTPCAGRPVLVSVVAQHPTNSATPIEVYIDGAPGRPQMVQFFAPNPQRKISLYAITPERIEDRQEITIAVQPCPQVTTTLELLHSRNPYNRDRVDFQAVLRGGRGRAYYWSFGDGTTAVTQSPFVSHDFAPEMNQSAKYSYFNVVVMETATNLASARRIAVGSSFALSRSLGFVQVDIATAITRTGQGLVVGLELANHHKSSITLDRYMKHYLPCNSRQRTQTQIVAAEAVLGPSPAIVHPPGVKSPGRVAVPKNGKVKTRLSLKLEDIPPDTCALGFNVIGTSADRKPVYGNFYLKVRQNRLFTRAVIDNQTLQTLEQLGADGLVTDPDEIAADQMYVLQQRGVVERTPNGWRRK